MQDNLAALSHKSRLMSDVLDRIDSIVGNKLEAARRF
ncbi:hypothetical protein FHT87_004667 [Rhizobium sp. BK316]|nr:hypothetical protein [Rhizobium sp. BK316]